MLKRTVVIILSLFMLLSMVPAFGESADWREPYAEPIKIHVAIEESSGANFAEGEDYGNNLWTKLFLERFNVEVVLDWSTTEYITKMNLAIASGEIPDSFACDPVQFEQLKVAGLLEDLTTAYNETASPSLVRMIDNNLDILETCKGVDGGLYAMPRLHYGFETLTQFIWARKDWVEQNGIEDIKTFEDLENMMKVFMENNGAKFGIMMDKGLAAFYDMAPASHIYPRIWVKGEDGTIVHGATVPEMKDYLSLWAKWYQEGFLRSDFATINEDVMRQDAYNGLVGMYPKANWAGWQVGKEMVDNQGEGTYFATFDLPSVDGEKVMYPIEFPNSRYNVVRKGYEYPEAMIKLINCYIDVLDDSIGAGTMTLEEVLPFNTNDMHHVTGPFKVEFAHYNDIKEVSSAHVNGTDGPLSTGNAFLFYNEILKWTKDQDLVGLGRYMQMGHEKASLVLAINHVDNDQILKSEIWGVRPQAVLDYGTTLSDLLTEGFTQIIMGVEDVDYFDTLIQEWYMAGGQEATDSVNEMYGNQ